MHAEKEKQGQLHTATFRRFADTASFVSLSKSIMRRNLHPGIRALAQLMQVEEEPLRLVLVRLLASSRWQPATVALARLALFDLSPMIREHAVHALQDRPLEEVRKILLDGLRYPWHPVADHAAEALVALRDTRAVPALRALLD